MHNQVCYCFVISVQIEIGREPKNMWYFFLTHHHPPPPPPPPPRSLGLLGPKPGTERTEILGSWNFSRKNTMYGERLNRLDLFSVQGRMLRADMIMVWKIFNNKCAISPDKLFTMNTSARRGHCFKIFMPRINLDTRKRFFSIRVIREWNDLGADTVQADSVETFKRLLHRDLGRRLFEYLDWVTRPQTRSR